ncbi:MAG TPA: hypothetical protein VFA71_03920 [Terriglobales bacterium]|nr:hypothetical protein [Terriglobales bacterium]
MSVFCHSLRAASSKSVYRQGETVTHVSADTVGELCSYSARNRLPACGVKKYQQPNGCERWIAIHVEVAGDLAKRVMRDCQVEKLSTEQYRRRLDAVKHGIEIMAEAGRWADWVVAAKKSKQMALPIAAPDGQVHRDE